MMDSTSPAVCVCLSVCVCVCVYVCAPLLKCVFIKKFKSREHLCVAMSSLFVGRGDGSVPAFPTPDPNAYHDTAQSSYH